LLKSDIIVEHYVCSDISEPLINLWNLIKDNPEELCEDYFKQHTVFKHDKEYFYEVRKRFNQYQNPKDFMFLLRTCANGMPRFNSSGQFNTPVHHGRDGIQPETFKEICVEWSQLLNKNNVDFICQPYEIFNPTIQDFCYLDPPYANTTGMYYGCIDYDDLWSWLRGLNSNYILSFDGKSGKHDLTYDVPKDIYTQHQYIRSGNSSFKRITHTSNSDIVYESLYIKQNKRL
jgi:DNA adenine methylase